MDSEAVGSEIVGYVTTDSGAAAADSKLFGIGADSLVSWRFSVDSETGCTVQSRGIGFADDKSPTNAD